MDALDGTQGLSLTCPEGKSLTLTVTTCHISIPPQSGLKTITYTSAGSGKTRDIRVDAPITGLKYTQTSKSFPGCTNGTYTGAITFEGLDTAGSPIGVWLE